MYKVFNTFTGSYEDCDTLELAKIRYAQILEHSSTFVSAKTPSNSQAWSIDLAFAKECYDAYWGANLESSHMFYGYTIFDIQNGEVKGRCFRVDAPAPRLIKVCNGVFLEMYEIQQYSTDTATLYSFSYDLEIKQPKWRYTEDAEKFTKYDYTTGEQVAVTFKTTEMPLEQQANLALYPEIAARMTQHGPRPYGYIVEYVEDAVMIPNPNYNAEVANLKALYRPRINVIYEAVGESGLIETTIIDTTAW